MDEKFVVLRRNKKIVIYKENDQQYLEEIKNGTSKLFPVVPNKIGNVDACSVLKKVMREQG